MPNDGDDLTALKRRRSTLVGSCTRIRIFVDAVESITPFTLAQLEERKNKIDGFWAEYDVVQTKLELLDIAEADHRISFEDSYYTISAKLRELMNPPIVPRSQFAPSTSNASNTVEHFNHIKLPKLDLPKFTGKYDEWFPFFDTFNSLIHVNAALSNIQKLQYLRASVIGDASKIICALEISEANYEVAWNLLKQRYDNKRVIVQSHVKAIMDLPSMVKENIVELRQIADGATRHIHALQALTHPTSHWDDILVHVLSSKLDALTSREWQLSLTGSELPTFKQFIDFVAHRCQTLETSSKSNAPSKNANALAQSNARRHSCVATLKTKCGFCKGEHLIYYCQDFLALPVSQRISEIRKRRLCTNCLRSTEHASSKCSSGGCKICKLKHNSLLHLATVATAKSVTPGSEDEAREGVLTSSPAALVSHRLNSFDNKHVMLSTAVVYAYDSQGSQKCCRVLLDSGSQTNFISQRFLTVLGLKARSLDISISGINKTATRSFGAAEVKLQSRTNPFSILVDCVVTDHVTDKIPAITLKRSAFEFPQNLKLADPQFNVSAEIDVLIGAEHFWNLLCVGQVKSSPMHPTLHKTRFGWILAGQLDASPNSSRKAQSFHALITNTQLHNQLTRFWQVEDVSEISNKYSEEESLCEQHFLQNVSRNRQGRFIVKLPFKERAFDRLGDSRDIALKRFRNLEKRFLRDPKLKSQYSQFINEYLALGHMKLIDEQCYDGAESFYLPHHCVFKHTAGSSKIRVVFDASSKGSTGVSLNDTLMVGPTVQQDLFSILLRFRFVLAADIIKMYRQIMVHSSQTRYQRILWRDNPTSEIKTYELITVTYGTSSASYLATRCLKWLAEHYANDFPIGSMCVGRDFYVDDVLTGADTISEAKMLREQTIQLLRLGAFELSKWASNCPGLLADTNVQNDGVFTIDTGMDSSILGVHWNQVQDTFHFSYKPDDNQSAVFKRVILSEVSRLFDPLGLLGPIIVLAKLILQELWQLGIHWDESVPQNLHSRWLKFNSQLSSINQICIPRCVKLDTNPQSIQIHGFCDASEKAYGAAIYFRTKLGNDAYHIELLCSKSRVAPLKAVSLPRLELLAAVLLARLVKKVDTAFSLSDVQTFLWSDSTIVLNWIVSPSRKWSTFVANRISEIQGATNPSSWRHIRSPENPADILSRGLDPQELTSSSLWWHGPAFLKLGEESWPKSDFARAPEDMPEQKRCTTAIAVIEHSIVNELLNKFSNLNKACRVLAYCLRITRSFRPAAPTIFISHHEASTALEAELPLRRRFAATPTARGNRPTCTGWHFIPTYRP
ncbi:uncharacterized protein LOC120358921 [Solenopsis invicta]|uniref:uncharacterized protein LOC120358921 n=1 Tax=Solenopsis invicta TaxID=13686 RepID=UPI00193D78C0|nr:uncharacterized protein LOC120358921 [Solenopsis invicta]